MNVSDCRIDEYYSKKEHYIDIIKSRLLEKRFIHSLNVAKEAVRLAKRYGENEKKAELAGLLHDVMKNTDPKEQLAYMLDKKLALTELELSSEKLWHAMSGACFIKYDLKIDDCDITNSVRYHTTARADMSLLEKIIYLADFTSEERDYNGVENMRRAVDISLELALTEALKFSIADLAERELAIHPDTLAAFNELALNKKEKSVNGGINFG